MKALKTVLAVLLICAIAASCATFALAAGYTYTVRVFPGNQASTVNGSAVYVIEGLEPGSRIEFDSSWVQPDNDKYYVMGFREAGKDNTTYAFSFPVTRDQDYVVAYGVKGEAVAYTVNYVDAAGNPLRDSETFNGNVGHRHVVAHRYIDGYLPQAYNLVKTLDADPANNVFTFVYSRIVVPTPTPAPTRAPAATNRPTGEGQEGNVGTQPVTETAEPQPEETQNVEPQPEETQSVEPQPEPTANPEEPTVTPEPEEIIDLDLPLSEYEGEQESKGLPLLLMIVIVLLILGLLALILYFLLGRRRKNEEEV